MGKQELAVVLDFDGTVITKDVSYALTQEFAHGSTAEAEQAYFSSEMSLGDLRKLEIAVLREPDEDSLKRRAVEMAVLRPGFAEFVAYCADTGIPLEIASAGLQLSIDAILGSAGLDVPANAPVVEWSETGTGVLASNQGVEICDTSVICKCSPVRRFQADGRRVVFAGDGTSDICPAREADFVLARDALAEGCSKEGIEFSEFGDFYDVQRFVASLAGS